MKKPKRTIEAERIFGASVETTRHFFLERLKEGVVADLDIKFWRARSTLQAKDLGLPKDVEKSLFMLGRKYLLPAELVHRIEALESLARKALSRLSTQSYWGSFVHYSDWQELSDELNKIRRKWDDLGAEIYRTYDSRVEDHKRAYREEIEAAWDQIKKLSGRSKKIETKEQFTRLMMSQFAEEIISVDEFMDRYSFTASFKRVEMPAEVEQNILKAQKQRDAQNLEQKRFDDKLQIQEEKKLLKLKKIQSQRATFDEIAEKKQQMMEEMHRAVVESAHKQKNEMIDAFMVNFTKRMRNILFGTASDLLDAVKKNGKLPARSLTQIKNLQKSIEKMSTVFQDPECEKMLAAIKLAAKKNKNISTQDVVTILDDVAATMRVSLLRLNTTSRVDMDAPALELSGFDTRAAGRRIDKYLEDDIAFETQEISRIDRNAK